MRNLKNSLFKFNANKGSKHFLIKSSTVKIQIEFNIPNCNFVRYCFA